MPPGQAFGKGILGSVGANVEADGGVDGARVRAPPRSGQDVTGRWTVNSRDARLLPRPVNALKLFERSPSHQVEQDPAGDSKPNASLNAVTNASRLLTTRTLALQEQRH